MPVRVEAIPISLRPSVRFLSPPLIDRIVEEARDVLGSIGLAIENQEVESLLLEAGARKSPNERLLLGSELIDRALTSAPAGFALYDREGEACADLRGDNVHFTPGSAAISILDAESGALRPPHTDDYVRYVHLVDRLDSIDYQSTAFIPADVPPPIQDSWRLFLSLVHGRKPVVTGAFTIPALPVMADMLLAVRGGREALAERPLAIFSCCPTAPLKWSDVTSQNVVDCARYRIPIELISMPLTGFVAPGTLVGSLVQHTAESLGGLAISQVAAAGTPVLWGGSPAIFDYRYETTPMGAVESQLLSCGHVEIGKHLGLPTQAYIGPSDSKALDAQAGLETASGVMLAALVGVNSVSGAGMLDFENAQSLEKLVVDNEICGMARRLTRGVEVREGDFPSAPHFEELLRDGHALIADHTRRWFRREVRFPGPTINRLNRARHEEEGSSTLQDRARRQVESLLREPPVAIDSDRRARLTEIMTRAAVAAGLDRLPPHDA